MKDKNFTKGNFVSKQRFIWELIFSLILFLLALSTCSQNLYAMRQPDAPGFQSAGTSSLYYYSPAPVNETGEPITGAAAASPGEEITAAIATGGLFVVSFTQHPSNSTVCAPGSTSFSVSATGAGALSYQWQESTNGGSSYNNILPSGTYSGVTSATLIVTGATNGMNGYRYRCVVTDASGNNTSNEAILTVNIGTGPIVQTDNTPHFICAAGGTSLTGQFVPNQTYQWQVSSNGGGSWGNITDGGSYTGSGTDFLIIGNASAMNGYLYRYISTATNGCQAISGVDTLHVFQPVINTQPLAATVCLGSAANFNVTASSPTTLSYQWQLGASNINNNATYSGVTTSSLTISNPTAAMDRQLYRVVIRDTLPCATNSNQVRLFVIAPPSISTQPQNANICAGLNTSFTVTATSATVSGVAALTYQWQTDNGTNGVSWSNVSGGTAATLPLNGVTMAMNGYRYRVLVTTGSCGFVTSSQVTLTVRSSGTWLGAVDTNWHVAGNWCGGVPISTTNVLIPNWAPRMPTISNTTGMAYSQSLTIENTAKLTISGGATSMSGPFDIQVTVAYTAVVDQPVLPANHGSLEINGSGNKILQVNTGISHNMVLGGNAKLVTGTNILTMRTGSNPIAGAVFSGGATSWIVTGNGSSGAANTGLGGLRFEQVDAADGPILFPIGPTSVSYNPAQVLNSGTSDDLTMAVNDRFISGGIINSGIDRTWLLSEATTGGSLISLELAWNDPEEQSLFNRALSEVIRSNGTSVVEHSATDSAIGTSPYFRSANSFVALNEFSVASYASVTPLPVKLKSFTAGRLSNTSAGITWETAVQAETPLYTVERSADAVHFNAIAVINGETGKTNYTFIDKNLSGNIAWYRLQIKTQDGKIDYSRTVQVAGVANIVMMQLRPSVTDKEVTTLFLSLAQKDNISIRLIDISGHVLLQSVYKLDKGQHFLPLKIAHLHKGIYYLHVTGNPGTIQVLPLIKQ